jgi:hypothetical protein
MRRIRHDKNLDAAVNRGLAAAQLIDIPTGVRIMAEAGVPPEIIARVVLAPQLRRASDWRH